MRYPWTLAGIAIPLLTAGLAQAQGPALGRNVISVVTSARHQPAPSARCLVWADAEGFDLGPDELSGAHGVNFSINPNPLPSENNEPTTFEDGINALHRHFPTTPAWLVETLKKNRAAIEAACRQDHAAPFVVHTITQKDVGL